MNGGILEVLGGVGLFLLGMTVMTDRLEPSLLKQPPVAIENVLATLREVSQVVFSSLASLLSSPESRTFAWDRIDDAARSQAPAWERTVLEAPPPEWTSIQRRHGRRILQFMGFPGRSLGTR